jgi:hypothetical protein
MYPAACDLPSIPDKSCHFGMSGVAKPRLWLSRCRCCYNRDQALDFDDLVEVLVRWLNSPMIALSPRRH